MKHSLLHRRRLLGDVASSAVAALVLVGLGGCASTPSPQADQQALLKRATEYWELSRKNDNVNAWKYEVASKDQSMTLEGYLKRGGIVYDAVDVRGVRSIEGDEAKVDVRMRYSVPLLRMKGQEVDAQDTWRRIEGEWYHVLPRSSLLPDTKR